MKKNPFGIMDYFWCNLFLQRSFAFLFCSIYCAFIYGQKGHILLSVKEDCSVSVDGSFYKFLQLNKTEKIELEQGEHLLQVKSIKDSIKQDSMFVINVEAAKQKVVIFSFKDKNIPTTKELILTDIEVMTDGSLSNNTIYTTNPGYKDEKSISSPVMYYAFEKGDKISINVSMENNKGTNFIYVSVYPENKVVYSDREFKEIKDLIIDVTDRSIYRFAIGSNHLFGRKLKIKISRIPVSQEKFNSNVIWQDTFIAHHVQRPQEFYLNSQTNITNGVTRVTVPVFLPKNTVEWYYIYTATRNQSNNNTAGMKLFGEIAGALMGTGGKILQLGIETLTVPPGDNFCNVYVLDRNNRDSFTRKLDFSYFIDGSRKNFKSSVVKVKNVHNYEYYIGLENPDFSHGIGVGVEIVAIVKEGFYRREGN